MPLMMIADITLFLIAFAAVSLLIKLGKAPAYRIGLSDKPGGRKKHDTAIPLIGGLTIFPVFIIMAALYGVADHYYYFFAALVILLCVGALDDKYSLSPRIRFITQFVVAVLIVIPGQAQLGHMGNMLGFGNFGLSFLAIPFSVVATVLLVNAINFIDGLDGLSAGSGIVCFFWLLSAAMMTGGAPEVPLLFIMIGALCGFGIFNMRHPLRKKASVFMGDAGSLALGLALAWFSIHMAKNISSPLQPIAVAWVLAIPIWDICGQFARRVKEGRHPFEADLNHFHHHFIDAGMSVTRATSLILLLSFCMGGIGVLGQYYNVPEYVLTYLWIAGLLGHIYLSIYPLRFKALIAKLHH